MILITGATGLVGSHLLRELSKSNNKIVAIYHNTPPDESFKNLATWIQADILDITSLEQAMVNIKQVYHCAAMVSFNPKQKFLLHQQNIDGTANVVNACINLNIEKLVYVSSVATLSKKVKGLITEKTTEEIDGGISEYGKTKYLAEMEVWRGIGEGLNAVIVNPSIILGAGNWDNGSTAIFKTAYNEFPWYTNGSNGFVDVEDVIKAMILLMNSTVVNERFILSGYNLTYRNVFAAIAKFFNKKQAHKKVTPFLAAIVWRIESLKSIFTGCNPLLTKETAATAQRKVEYDNNKFLMQFTTFKYGSFETSIERICNELKKKYNLVKN